MCTTHRILRTRIGLPIWWQIVNIFIRALVHILRFRVWSSDFTDIVIKPCLASYLFFETLQVFESIECCIRHALIETWSHFLLCLIQLCDFFSWNMIITIGKVELWGAGRRYFASSWGCRYDNVSFLHLWNDRVALSLPHSLVHLLWYF